MGLSYQQGLVSTNLPIFIIQVLAKQHHHVTHCFPQIVILNTTGERPMTRTVVRTLGWILVPRDAIQPTQVVRAMGLIHARIPSGNRRVRA